MKYKNWSTDPVELPPDDKPPLEIFKLNEEGEQMIPEGIPSLVEPQFDRKMDLDLVKKNVEKMKDFLTWGEYSWWEDFFRDPSAAVTSNTSIDGWYLTDLQPYLTEPNEPANVNEGSILALKMQKERVIPEVSS